MEEIQVPKESLIHSLSKNYNYCVHVINPGSLEISDEFKLNASEFQSILFYLETFFLNEINLQI